MCTILLIIIIVLPRFHGHDCELTKDLGVDWEKKRENLLKRTKARESLIKRDVTHFVTKWECEFMRDMRLDKEIGDMMKNLLPEYYLNHPNNKPTGKKLIDAIENGSLFVGAEVDIEVRDCSILL